MCHGFNELFDFDDLCSQSETRRRWQGKHLPRQPQETNILEMPEFIQQPATLSALIAFIVGLVIAALYFKAQLSSVKAAADERTKSTDKTISDHEIEKTSLKSELETLRSSESALLQHQSKLEAQIESFKRQQNETNQLEKRFSDTFKSLSNDALKSTQQQFLDLAKTTFKTEQKQARGELEKREQAVAHLVKPVAESLDKMQTRISEIEKAREGAYSSIKEQVHSLVDSQKGLHKETRQLVKALRQPTGRGQWGEMQLQRVVEMAGMQEHCDFTTQTSTTTDEGKRLRPDLIVKLPGGKQIIVDSKTPMDAYLDALEADSDEDRDGHLARHANQVSTHIRQLASKNYQAQFQPAPEFVVLFLPSESFFSAALTQDSSLLEQGVDQNVILATPTTLIALLRSVAYGWRQEALAENARRISDTGRELHKRLTVFSGHLGKVGRALDTSVKSYNSAVSSLESRILPSARKFENLEASEQSLTFESPNSLEITAKHTQSLEAPADDITLDLEEPPAGEVEGKASSAAGDFRAALEES